MVTRYRSLLNRIKSWLPALSLIAGAVSGCAFPHGTYQGDPAFGNFNRPIAASPPVFSGGDPGMGPAFDGGARLGMPSPDVPDPASVSGTSKASWLLPTYSISGGLLGIRGSSGGGTVSGGGGGGGGNAGSEKTSSATPATNHNSRQVANAGAKLQGVDDGRKPLLANTSLPASSDPTSVTFRTREPNTMLMSGSAIVPPGPSQDQPVVGVYDRSRDAVAIRTIEEGQVILASYGVKWQRLEQVENGEWLFTCSKGNNPNGTSERRYESRNADQIMAVRKVIEQLRMDKYGPSGDR